MDARTSPFIADSQSEAWTAGQMPDFPQLVREHQARVFSVAWRLLGNREEAEELAQDVFVQLYEKLTGMQGPDHVRHWLLRTVSHRAIDQLRSRRRRVQTVALDDSQDIAAASSNEDPLAERRLGTLLAQLQPDARATVLLRYQEDMAPSEIAAVLHMPVNTVKSHLRRSLDWLREQTSGVEYGY